MAIDALKALQGWIIDRGFQEGEFDVTGAESWFASCRLFLHAPDPERSGAVLILREDQIGSCCSTVGDL